MIKPQSHKNNHIHNNRHKKSYMLRKIAISKKQESNTTCWSGLFVHKSTCTTRLWSYDISQTFLFVIGRLTHRFQKRSMEPTVSQEIWDVIVTLARAVKAGSCLIQVFRDNGLASPLENGTEVDVCLIQVSLIFYRFDYPVEISQIGENEAFLDKQRLTFYHDAWGYLLARLYSPSNQHFETYVSASFIIIIVGSCVEAFGNSSLLSHVTLL